jgi:hypothetical protein
MSTVTDFKAPIRSQSAGGSDEAAERLVRELHEALRAAVGPYRAPTADELWDRVIAVTHLLPELRESGITEEEVEMIATLLISRAVETRISERISDSLAEVFPPVKQRERGFGRLAQLAWSNG